MIINKFAKWMLCVGLTAAAAGTVEAGPIEFVFKDPKKVNNALFLLDARRESISGTAPGITEKLLSTRLSRHRPRVRSPSMRKHCTWTTR